MPYKADRKCLHCPTLVPRDSKTGLCRKCYDLERTHTRPSTKVANDREKAHLRSVTQEVQSKYNQALKTIEQQEKLLGWLEEIRMGVSTTFQIKPKEGSGTSEATPVLVASDWHSEELVRPSQVMGLNEFNPDICDKRVTKFFQSGLRLIRLLNQDVKISTMVLALLGDFITNQIHEAANAETNALLPMDAVQKVQGYLIGGLDFLLNHSKYELIIPCKVGNHSRTTKKVRWGSEEGHSLESLIYAFLADHYRNESRVKVIVQNGYHTFLDVYDKTIRFHHGHAIQYQGGIGGIFIPAYKAIAQWNKARRADLDVFGHFHQSKDGDTFITNGSLIGYSPFGVSIKGDYEPPQQQLFLMDKKRGRTCRWPVYL